MEKQKVVVGIGYMDVLVKSPKPWQLYKRLTNRSLTNIALGIQPGLRGIATHEQTVFAGVRTTRPKLLRGGNTRKGLNNILYHDTPITHSGHSMKKNIERLLLTAADIPPYGGQHEFALSEPHEVKPEIDRIFLVEADYKKAI